MLFALVALDRPNAVEDRLRVRPDYLKFLDSLGDSLLLAGPFLNDKGESVGSIVIIESESLDTARAAFAAFPDLSMLAWTRRVQHRADDHALSAVLHTRTASVTGGSYRLSGIVDDIGTGDAFAAGVLHGLQSGMAPADVAGFALAAAAMKHAITGDFNGARTGASA